MVDFAALNERTKKRDRTFEVWRATAFSGRDWLDLTQSEREHIRLAFNRGYGQGYAQGKDGCDGR